MEIEHTTDPSPPLPVYKGLATGPESSMESNRAEDEDTFLKTDKGDTKFEANEGDAAPGVNGMHGVEREDSTKEMQPDDADKADQEGTPEAGPPELSTSPSSLSQSLSSALVAAMKVPSFSGAFKRSSSSAPEQTVLDLNERPPSDQPGLAQSSPPPSTSYFPSPASFTSFFSGGSKPRAIPPATFPPGATTSAPGSVEPLQGSLADLLTSAGTSAPVSGAQTVSSVDAFPVRVGSPPTKEPVSGNSGAVSAASLTQLMKAAAPYFTSGSKQASESEAGAGKQSIGGVQSGDTTEAATCMSSIAGPSETPSVNLERSASVTTSVEQRTASPTSKSDITPSAVSSQPEPSSSRGNHSPSQSFEPPSLQSVVFPTSSSSAQEVRPVTTSPELPVSTPPERNPPSHLDLEQAPGTLTRDTPPASAPPGSSPGQSARESPPVTSANILPGTSAQTASPGTQSQESLPGASSQGVQPGSSAQATSPGTSYLSLPSFLPTWSTITAQLPSMPGAPFINREQEPAPEAAQKPAAAKQPFPTPPSDASGTNSSGQSVGASAEAVDASPSKPGSSQHVESLPVQHTDANKAGLGSIGTAPGVRESANQGRSQPGGTEQTATKPELDPPSAAAADAIARGLAGIFGPITMEADKQIEAALQSQEKLAMSIDRLTRGLDKLLEESPQPVVAQQAARLAHMRKRVQALAAALKVIQGRIDSMNWALDRKSSRVPFARGRSATAPNSPHSYQALTDSVSRNRQAVPGSQSRGSGTQILEHHRPGGSAVTGNGSQQSLSGAPSSRGADVADGDRLAAGRGSSRSPEKGHRRAMSHDVRFSAGLSNKG